MRFVLVGLVPAGGGNQRAIHPVGIRRARSLPEQLVLVAVVVGTVRHQDVIGAAAAQISRSVLLRRIGPWPLRIGTLEILAHRHGGVEQRCAIVRPHILLDPLEEGLLVDPLEAAYALLDHTRALAIDIGLALVDPAKAQAHIPAHLAVEGLTHRAGCQQVAHPVVLVPVGKVLVFLLLRAVAQPLRHLRAIGSQIRTNIDTIGSLGNDETLEVCRTGGVQFLFRIARIVRTLQAEIRGRINRTRHGVAWIVFAAAVVPAQFLADVICMLARDGHLPHQVHPQRIVIEKVIRRLWVCIGLTRTVRLHPRQIQHLRVVVERVHIRRAPARRQQTVGPVGQGTIQCVAVGEAFLLHHLRFAGMEGLQPALPVIVRQEVVQHRPRIIQREDHVRFDDGRCGHHQRVLGHLRLGRQAAHAGHHHQGQLHGTASGRTNARAHLPIATLLYDRIAVLHHIGCHERLPEGRHARTHARAHASSLLPALSRRPPWRTSDTGPLHALIRRTAGGALPNGFLPGQFPPPSSGEVTAAPAL